MKSTISLGRITSGAFESSYWEKSIPLMRLPSHRDKRKKQKTENQMGEHGNEGRIVDII